MLILIIISCIKPHIYKTEDDASDNNVSSRIGLNGPLLIAFYHQPTRDTVDTASELFHKINPFDFQTLEIKNWTQSYTEIDSNKTR